MNAPVLDWKVKQFSAVPGSSTVNWDTFDFTSAPFPSSASFTALKCIINVDCVAVTASDANYNLDYSAVIAYCWKPSGSNGQILSTFVNLNNGGSFVTWSTSVGGAGSLRVSATISASVITFNITMAARIVSYCDA